MTNLLRTSYRSIFCYSVSIALLLAVSGCQQGNKAIGSIDGAKLSDGNIPLPCKFGEEKNTASASASKSKITLTIDGSASMVGYTKDLNSRYVKTLKLLDRVTENDAEYARIDNGRKSIGRNEFTKSFSTSFYTGQISKLADALPDLKAAKEDKLLAIITDLQPDDGDIERVSKRIRQDYLNKAGYAVAIWGIRSEFEGKVYPPNNAPAYDYASKSADNGRPFYILFLGKYEAIADLAKTLRDPNTDKDGLLKNNSYLTIFTADRAIASPSYLKIGQEDNLPQGFRSPSSLSQDRFSVENGDQPIQFLEIDENSNPDKQSLKYAIEYRTNPDTAIPTQLEPRYRASKYNEERDKPAFVDKNISLADLSSSSIDNNKLNIEMKLDPAKIDRGLYYLTVDLNARSIQVPTAWKEWDDSGKKDGSKTQGLSDFLNSLSINTASVMKEKPSVAARLCYGIQRN
jgi:hypothetical protein